jgi:hypothetical protein
MTPRSSAAGTDTVIEAELRTMPTASRIQQHLDAKWPTGPSRRHALGRTDVMRADPRPNLRSALSLGSRWKKRLAEEGNQLG